MTDIWTFPVFILRHSKVITKINLRDLNNILTILLPTVNTLITLTFILKSKEFKLLNLRFLTDSAPSSNFFLFSCVYRHAKNMFISLILSLSYFFMLKLKYSTIKMKLIASFFNSSLALKRLFLFHCIKKEKKRKV